jgi:hypothetical protein
MAEFFPPVIFEVKAKATEAIATFKEVNHELNKMEKNASNTSKMLVGLERSARLTRAAVLSLGAGFAVVGYAGVKAALEAQVEQAKLRVAIENTGVSWANAAPYVNKYTRELENLGFTNEETMVALQRMTAATRDPQQAFDALATAADLARFKNISLADAGILLARASTGQARGLADLGIAMGKTIPKGASFASILKMVEDRTKGTAKAFANTNPLSVFNAKLRQLEEDIGLTILPAFNKLVNFMTNTFLPKLRQVGDWFSKHKGIVQTFGAALASVWVTGKLFAFISALQKVIGVFRTLAATAFVAAGAEALATGGLNIAVGTAAFLPVLEALGFASVGGLAAYYASRENKQSSLVSTTSGGSSQFVKPGTLPAKSTLKGVGVKKITPTPKPTPTVQQNITVYASNTDDIAKKMSKAAKNGLPLGSK